MIPGELELTFNFRYATASTPREPATSASRRSCKRHGLDYELTWTGAGAPYLTPRGELVSVAAQAIGKLCGIVPEVSRTGGTSDGRFIAAICREIVELGPVNATIHKLDECVAIAELEPLAALYRGILERLLLGAAAAMSTLTQELETVRDWLRYAVSRFDATGLFFGHGTTNAYDEAAYLLLHTLHLPLDRLEPFLDAKLTPRRARGSPRRHRPPRQRAHSGRVSHARGVAGRAPLLRRRAGAHSALVYRRAAARRLEFLDPRPGRGIHTALDLCTGSGCLAILMAHQFPNADVDAADISSDALAVALRNVTDHAVQDRVNLIRSDLLSNLTEKTYDLIVSNPPYVTAMAMEELPARIPSTSRSWRSPAATTAWTRCARSSPARRSF